MSAARNDFVLSLDPCRSLRKAFAQWREEAAAQAEATSKAAEQERYRASYAKRREPNEPETAA